MKDRHKRESTESENYIQVELQFWSNERRH